MIVSLSPGVHLRKLQKLLGTSFSTARYHVESLERDGEIVCVRDGRYQRLYPSGTADGLKTTYAVLQSKTARKILGALAREGKTSQGDLCEIINLPRSTLSEHASLLCNAELVIRHITVDGHILYEIQDRDRTFELLAAIEKNLLNIAADRLIDLWDL